MSKRVPYRKQLLRVVEAFLEGTPSSRARAQQILQRCSAELSLEAKEATVDEVIWQPFVMALTDSIFSESKEYLQEVLEILRGHSPLYLARTAISQDFRPEFTAHEVEWYAQLLSMMDFLLTIPFAQMHEAIFPAWQQHETWPQTRKSIPEVLQVEEIDEEYQRRKTLLTTLAARNSLPQTFGDEKIYRLILREVTGLVTGIRVGGPAVIYGYPIPAPPYSGPEVNMTESILLAKRALEALSGKGGIFLSWRLSPAPTFGSDLLLVSWY